MDGGIIPNSPCKANLEEEMGKQLQDVLFCPSRGKKSLGISTFPLFDAQTGNRIWWPLEEQEAPTNQIKSECALMGFFFF